MGGNRNDDAMGTLDIGEGIVALADLGERRGEKGILEPYLRLEGRGRQRRSTESGLLQRGLR